MNNMPPTVKNLLIINILMFAGRYVASLYNINLDDLLGLHFVLASDFHAYQLFTYMFMHASVEHLLFNMFAVWMFGRIMESTMGAKRFLFYYLTCGLGAGLIQEMAQFGHYFYAGLYHYEQVNTGMAVLNMGEYLNLWTTVGASGAVYGILLSFGMFYPNERMFFFPCPVPIKAKYFIMGYAVIELLAALANRGDHVAHMAHLGGMLVGLLLILYWRNGGGTGRGGSYGSRSRFFGRQGGSSRFFEWFSSLTRRKEPRFHVSHGGKFQQDMEYRQRKKEEEAEMDRILDKVRKHGYGALTEEEKKRLFDMGKNQ